MAEFEDFMQTVRRLLAGEPARLANGYEARMTWLEQPAPVPLFGAASGPKMTRLVARIADGAILLQGIAEPLLERAMAWLAEGAAEAGRTPEAISTACWVPLGLDDDAGVARDQVRVRAASAVMNAKPDWFEGKERDAVLRLQASYKDYQHAAADSEHARILPDEVVDRYAIAGTPEMVRERLLQLMAHDGVDHVILTPQASADDRMDLSGLLHRLDREVLAKV
jgi:5,10-methylenetetrahydromethanopterin reductase